ncbi:hypothetical protein HN51_051629 [Arachis hypogaea]
MFVYSISWAGWVPYALAGCSIFGVFVRPSIYSIASKQVGPNEQVPLLKFLIYVSTQRRTP